MNEKGVEIEELCSNCRFFFNSNTCHRHPPTVSGSSPICNAEEDAGGITWGTIRSAPNEPDWPNTHPEMWCGEWRPRSGPGWTEIGKVTYCQHCSGMAIEGPVTNRLCICGAEPRRKGA